MLKSFSPFLFFIKMSYFLKYMDENFNLRSVYLLNICGRNMKTGIKWLKCGGISAFIN